MRCVMSIRTSTRSVFFTRPFRLRGVEESLPPGHYEVETDEEFLEGLSFAAYKRVRTLLHLQPSATSPVVNQTLEIEQADLDSALRRDTIAEGANSRPEATSGRLDMAKRRLRKEADKRAIERGENEGMPDPDENSGPAVSRQGHQARRKQELAAPSTLTAPSTRERGQKSNANA
jgi:hypothetical protein